MIGKVKFVLLLILALHLTSCTSTETSTKEPANIILLIGDGMSLSSLSITVYFGDGFSEFSRFPQQGLAITSSVTHKVTDSAASGTAMASGVLTYNGAIGMDTTGTAVPNMIEFVSGLGWSTGVVATSSITHATPASFYAHVRMRSMEPEIAAQLLESEVDFFAGGGLDFFRSRSDSPDLLQRAAEKGFRVDTTALADPGSLAEGEKYGFLLAGGGMPALPGERGDFLAEATSLAIGQLSKSEKGFFLMVEGSQIDWAAHANNTESLIPEMLDFEKAVAAALDFAEKEGNTLVVVTGDHETGGVTLIPFVDEATGQADPAKLGFSYATTGHSASLVPVFAYGPGSERFGGIYQNTGIHQKMVEVISPEE